MYIDKNVKQNDYLFQIVNEGEKIIEFKTNGDIFVKDKLIENDKEIVEAFREFLKKQGLIN